MKTSTLLRPAVRYLMAGMLLCVRLDGVSAQTVLPTPESVILQQGELMLAGEVSLCASDTAAFHIRPFRTEVLRKASRAQVSWMDAPPLYS